MSDQDRFVNGPPIGDGVHAKINSLDDMDAWGECWNPKGHFWSRPYGNPLQRECFWCYARKLEPSPVIENGESPCQTFAD